MLGNWDYTKETTWLLCFGMHTSPISKTYGKQRSFLWAVAACTCSDFQSSTTIVNLCAIENRSVSGVDIYLLEPLHRSHGLSERWEKKKSCNITDSVYPIFPYPTSAWNASSQDSVKSRLYCSFLGLLCLYLLKSSVSSCINAAPCLTISLLSCCWSGTVPQSKFSLSNTSDLFLKSFTWWD